MELVIKSALYDLVKDTFAGLHVEQANRYDDAKGYKLNLSTLTRPEVDRLYADLSASQARGVRVLVADLRRYVKAADEGANSVQARTCRQAAWLLEHYFAALPHHLIFSTDEYEGGSHTGYYVADVDYEPYKAGNNSRDRQPERVEVEIVWIEDDTTHKKTLVFEPGDCIGMTPKEMLKERGFVPETPELIAKLEAETNRFYATTCRVGLQCTATGVGLADLDDLARNKDNSNRWNYRRVKMNNFGVESRVIVDVLFEGDSDKRKRGDSGADFDLYRWHDWNLRFFSPSEDVLARHLEADEDTAERPMVQVPVHPLVPCFDLKRHLRLRVHVNNLTEYEYRRQVSEGLILPEVDRRMINILVDQSQNTFQDIVSGKGSSMNILSSGPPGTGKTVTAEVFAEFKGRPLYTVQCSQLGLDPEDVEKNLSIILTRANRWNAVLLLDEADVYIRQRADDIQQNAIVGVFLRILEYASCILFMTTNLPENVDDAVASRCIVHLHYGVPTPEAQAEIWQILSKLNDIDMPAESIAKFVVAHPTLTGRDVKNLLKLASFIAAAEVQEKVQAGELGAGAVIGNPRVTLETLELALRFKPTLSTPTKAEVTQ